MDKIQEQFIEQEEHLKIKYEGTNEISLNALTNTLHSFDELTKLAVKDRFQYEFKITACEKGNFVLDIFSMVTVAQNLLTSENVMFMKNCLSTIKEWFELKKHLQGKPPYKVEEADQKVKVTNMHGDIYTTSIEGSEILNNANINANVINIGCNLINGSRTGFTIQDGNEDILSVSEEDYDYISSGEDIGYKNKIKKLTIRTTLMIVKPDLYGNSKWEFYYNVRIPAKIEDENWKKQIENHTARFTRGTQLDVDLRIEVPLDKDNIPIENQTSYYVEKVYEIIQPQITEDSQTKIN